MAAIIYNVILIASFLFLLRKKEDTEPYFPLKIIGYFLLGSFAFNFNQISLPLGFIAYLLFFRPKLNLHVKKLAVIFGVLSFIVVHWIFPYAIEQWEHRTVSIEHELGSVFTMNFRDDYELIKQELKFEDAVVKLQDFNVDYLEDGSITAINWQLVRQEEDNSFYLYQIQYDFRKNRYQVINGRSDSWFQYNRLIDADHFFENLEQLDIKDLTQSKGSFSSYVIQSSGERIMYAADLRTHYFFTNGEMKLLNNEQLPVEGYVVSTFAMKKLDEEKDEQGNIIQETFEGTEPSDYLFDVKFDSH